MAKIQKGALYSMRFKEKGEEPMNSPNLNKWKELYRMHPQNAF